MGTCQPLGCRFDRCRRRFRSCYPDEPMTSIWCATEDVPHGPHHLSLEKRLPEAQLSSTSNPGSGGVSQSTGFFLPPLIGLVIS